MFHSFVGYSDGNADLVLDVFEKSVPMSTYLVAFIISDFAEKSVRIDDRITFGGKEYSSVQLSATVLTCHHNQPLYAYLCYHSNGQV